ncbi:hypothetical protein SAMN05444287_0843 [Octadecabacter temperatus]|jgi:hypothetical protein|uniref:Uncharacterized protein n=1 Tax=Octadecabacter temperatus TaxID=1458307 RepID=A0A0K0Y498_9RHOB|nr:hypothetical protein [Octadecabacter temperatus]AKS45745.1 hypothetical protein OSB_11890 [Octadecabacter temperatus]SIN99581.1 hypothetical protein SAMN05444287_0843 [Octadecabacter temperatus]
MSKPKRTEFLERSSYRQRRIRDGARLLPIIALVLMVLPLMWPRNAPEQSLTSSGIIYIFFLWMLLIVCAYALSRVLRLSDPVRDEEARTPRGGE